MEAKPTKPEGRWGNGRGGRPWRRLVEAVKRRDQLTCRTCKRLAPYGNCDHIVPASKNGTDDMSNLQWLCIPCHDAKSLGEAGFARTERRIVPIGVDGWPTA